jgi:hypothetical protein
MIFMKKCFLFMLGSVCSIKRFITGAAKNHLGGKRFGDNEEVETEVCKWLRQQSKDFCAVGFNGFSALVKRWSKCINVGGGYVKK